MGIVDIIETICLGFVAVVFFGFLAFLISGCVMYPKIALEIVFGLGFVFIAGLLVKLAAKYNGDRIYRKKYGKLPSDPITIGIPVIDNLKRLEKKYNVSTVDFMAMVKNGTVPPLISNLDHLEWVGLVVELSNIEGKEN